MLGHTLHTGGVAGSIPASPTIITQLIHMDSAHGNRRLVCALLVRAALSRGAAPGQHQPRMFCASGSGGSAETSQSRVGTSPKCPQGAAIGTACACAGFRAKFHLPNFQYSYCPVYRCALRPGERRRQPRRFFFFSPPPFFFLYPTAGARFLAIIARCEGFRRLRARFLEMTAETIHAGNRPPRRGPRLSGVPPSAADAHARTVVTARRNDRAVRDDGCAAVAVGPMHTDRAMRSGASGLPK